MALAPVVNRVDIIDVPLVNPACCLEASSLYEGGVFRVYCVTWPGMIPAKPCAGFGCVGACGAIGIACGRAAFGAAGRLPFPTTLLVLLAAALIPGALPRAAGALIAPAGLLPGNFFNAIYIPAPRIVRIGG